MGQKNFGAEQIKVLAALVIFSGVVGFFYWKYVWVPFSKRTAAAETKIAAASQEIAKALGMVKRLDSLDKEIAQLRAQETDAEKRLPKGKKLPDLIYTVMAISRRTDVVIGSISPQNSTDKQYYTEVRYQLAATGRYHALGRFLATMATSQRVFSIQNLSLSSDGDKVTARFTLVAYQYKS